MAELQEVTGFTTLGLYRYGRDRKSSVRAQDNDLTMFGRLTDADVRTAVETWLAAGTPKTVLHERGRYFHSDSLERWAKRINEDVHTNSRVIQHGEWFVLVTYTPAYTIAST